MGLQLLLDTSLNLPPEALFFAANMIHTKVIIVSISIHINLLIVCVRIPKWF